MRVLVTGANGYIGRHLIKALTENGHTPIAITRRKDETLICEKHILDLENLAESKALLKTVDVIIHLAATVHISAPYQEANKTNVTMTKRLFEAARENNIKQFIFMSTIAVYAPNNGTKISVTSKLDPTTVYGKTKLRAETELLELSEEGVKTELKIIRIPMVYGPNAPGNYAALEKLVRLRIPLPFKGINNRRSMIEIDCLCAKLIGVINSQKNKTRVFLFCDHSPLSTENLIRLIARSNNIKPLLFRGPTGVVQVFLCALGKKSLFDKLFGSLEIQPTSLPKK